jgi:hypothetical protein
MSLLLGGVFFVGGSGVARGSTSRTVDPCEPVKIGTLSGMDQLDSRDAARCREQLKGSYSPACDFVPISTTCVSGRVLRTYRDATACKNSGDRRGQWVNARAQVLQTRFQVVDGQSACGVSRSIPAVAQAPVPAAPRPLMGGSQRRGPPALQAPPVVPLGTRVGAVPPPRAVEASPQIIENLKKCQASCSAEPTSAASLCLEQCWTRAERVACELGVPAAGAWWSFLSQQKGAAPASEIQRWVARRSLLLGRAFSRHVFFEPQSWFPHSPLCSPQSALGQATSTWDGRPDRGGAVPLREEPRVQWVSDVLSNVGPYPCDVIGTENQKSIFAEAFSEGPPEGLARSRHPDREQDPPLVLGEEGTLDDYYTLLRYPADGFFTHLVLRDCRQQVRSLRLGPADFYFYWLLRSSLLTLRKKIQLEDRQKSKGSLLAQTLDLKKMTTAEIEGQILAVNRNLYLERPLELQGVPSFSRALELALGWYRQHHCKVGHWGDSDSMLAALKPDLQGAALGRISYWFRSELRQNWKDTVSGKSAMRRSLNQAPQCQLQQ